MQPATLLATGLLVAAGLANLPIVYALVADGAVSPAVCLAFGFVAMGLAWAGGFLLEGKRRWFTLLMAGVGAFELGLAFVPVVVDLSSAMRPYLAAAGALSVGALATMLSRRRAQPG